VFLRAPSPARNKSVNPMATLLQNYRSALTIISQCICVALSACGGSGVTAPVTAIAAIDKPIDTLVPPLSGWRLVWSDEFNGDGLPDTSKWGYDTSRNQLGWFNNELQYYARDRLENSRIENGRLIITARKEKLTSASDYGNQSYTSARLITQGKASWTYGYFEIRAKLPCGLGTWPAIWMLGTKGAWPDDGEIDIMEQTGQDKTHVLGTVHTRAYNYFNGTLGTAQGANTPVANACNSFHNYQLTWTAEKIVMGVDGINYFEYANSKNADYGRWPFDSPQFLILNLAIGGDLGGAVDPGFVEQQIEVDYVRVYQP
jgi:beta-glucanase (GH16 family)